MMIGSLIIPELLSAAVKETIGDEAAVLFHEPTVIHPSGPKVVKHRAKYLAILPEKRLRRFALDTLLGLYGDESIKESGLLMRISQQCAR